MLRKTFIAAAAILATACAHAPERRAADQSAELKRIADGYLEAIVEQDPFVVYFNLSDLMAPDHARLPDISAEADAAFRAKEDALYAELLTIDPAWLYTRGDWVTYQALRETMAANTGLRQCNQRWWSVNHMGGWQSYLGDFAAEQPVATADEKRAALRRWRALPKLIADDRAHLERGLEEGYSAPKSVVERVIAQLDALAKAPAAEHPFATFLQKTDDAEFRSEVIRLFQSYVIPAIAEHRDFLEQIYLPRAREDLAIASLPNGRECYEAMLRAWHGADIGSEKTYQRGQEAVARNRAGVIERGQAKFGVSDFAEILKRVQEAPDNRFKSEAELIEFTRALVPQTRAKVAPFFARLPSQELVVEPYADYLKGTGMSSRYEQRPEGEGPATYRIDSDDWETQTKGVAERVAVHEGWPGHHLQIARSREVEGLHPVTRLTAFSAYVEGWARYSEALAEEAGVYKNGYGEISRRAWPARGMVVDPGLHLYGWTNEQAIAFLKESGSHTDKTARDMLDRIAVMPGQLTAYDTGGLEIFALRAEAERRLGSKFDLADFHERILENGSLPLAALREHVE